MAEHAPGWYYGPGDPVGTMRRWDGTQWVSGPVPAPGTSSFEASPPIETSLHVPSAVGKPTVHGREVAEAGVRVGAVIVDGIVGMVFAIPMMVSMFSNYDWNAAASGVRQPMTVDRGLAGLSFALTAVYTVASVAMFGSTIGKRVFNLEVVRASDGRTPPGWQCAFLRAVPALIPTALSWALKSSPSSSPSTGVSALGLIVPLVSFYLVLRRGIPRSLADRAGGTYVVRRRRP